MSGPFQNQVQSGPRPIPLQVEDQYNKRIDDDIAKLVDCFSDIIKIGEVRSSESLLSLITELKQHLLLNDTHTLSCLYKERSEALTAQKQTIQKTLLDIRRDLASAIYDMESVHYKSVIQGPLVHRAL
ncbi:hypothetical protein BDF14DRAFT_1732773 [Spinellus fusiger]|nr:hypothetical protein BDF14DRAFT_1732773 [Spinellus fusiger]